MHSRAEARPAGALATQPVPELQAASGTGRLPVLAKLALLSLLIPADFSVGSLTLNPSKLLFLMVVPVLTVNLLRGTYGRLVLADALIFVSILWMNLAMFANHPPRVAIEFTGSIAVLLLGGYLTARATIRSKADFVAMIRFLAIIVAISLPFAIYETNTGLTTIPRWLEDLPHITSHEDINHDPRLGFWRVQWVFAHPIHYGIFCSLAFSLVLVGMTGIWGVLRRYVTAGIVGLCCFLSVSSGPFLAMMAQLGLILWGSAMHWTGRRWRILAMIGLSGYVVLEVITTRPALFSIVTQLSFSPSTAFARRTVFEYGIQQVGRTPFLGVGYTPWPLPPWMTGSLDNFWLLLAVAFGVPAFVLFIGAFLWTMIAAGRRNLESVPEVRPLRLAWMFTIISLVLVLATVHIWGQIYSLVLFVFGSGMWMINLDTSVARTVPRLDVAAAKGARVLYTRFPVRKPARDLVTSSDRP